MKYTLRNACKENAQQIDYHLSKADIEESLELGVDPEDVTERAYKATRAAGGEVWAVWSRDELVAVFGVTPNSIVGVPWLLGVEQGAGSPNWRRLLLQPQAREIIYEWRQRYGFLMNYISVSNAASVRFLKRLGFTFSRTANPNILVFSMGTTYV